MPRMPQATEPSHAHTGSEEVIVGVDTHKDVHVAAVISVLGVLLGTASFPATAAVTGSCSGGHPSSGCCVEPGWSAPAPTAQR